MAPANTAPEVLQVWVSIFFSGTHLDKGTELQGLNIFEMITFIKLGRKFGIPLEAANRMIVLALFPQETRLNKSPTDTNLWKPLSALEESFACHPQYSQLVLSPFLSSSQKCARHQDYDLCLSESKIVSMFRLPSQPLCVPKGTIILFYSNRLVQSGFQVASNSRVLSPCCHNQKARQVFLGWELTSCTLRLLLFLPH